MLVAGWERRESVYLISLQRANSPEVFWSGASLVSAVLEVIELAFKGPGERLPAD